LYRAFHVFKVFVANPKKPSEICSILYQNKTKLIPFLEAFQTDKGDEQFNDEKKLLIE
jgi:calcium binding protein 39